jgi:hypothetical protein
VACPGDDADKFLLPLNQNLFWQAFLQKNLTGQFFDEKTLEIHNSSTTGTIFIKLA